MNAVTMRRILLVLASFSIVLGLVACQRESSSKVARKAAVASRAGSAALDASQADDSKEALMRVAFPKWDGKRAWVLDVPGSDPKDGPGTATVAATPRVVLPLDDTHRVLVVTDVPSDEDGHDLGAHASQGNLGAYWFVRRDGRWIVAARNDSVMWGGVSGDVGTPKAVDLGGGHLGVAIETGSCWQGDCADWMSVVEFDAAAAHILVKELRTLSSSISASDACQVVLAGGEAGKPDEENDAAGDEAQVTADNCFDVSGKWRILPRPGSERGDLVVTYSGTDLVERADGKGVAPRAIHETLVLRLMDGAYKQVSGRDPTHTF
jgi:hypothetical protein